MDCCVLCVWHIGRNVLFCVTSCHDSNSYEVLSMNHSVVCRLQSLRNTHKMGIYTFLLEWQDIFCLFIFFLQFRLYFLHQNGFILFGCKRTTHRSIYFCFFFWCIFPVLRYFCRSYYHDSKRERQKKEEKKGIMNEIIRRQVTISAANKQEKGHIAA